MKIASKFNLIAMFLISLTLLTVSYASFTIAEKPLKSARLEQLRSIASLKVEQIQAFIFERKADIRVVQDYFNIKTNLPIMSQYQQDRSNPVYQHAKKMLDDQLRVFYTTYHYAGLVLLSKEGQVVYAANPAHIEREIDRPLPDPGNRAFEEGRKNIYVSEIFQDEGKRDKFFVSAPIDDFQGKFAGVIALEVELVSSFLFVQNTTGLGQTGETLIGRISDDELLFLNARRHESHANSIPNGLDQKESAFPMWQATQGKEGHGISIDYRGEEVLAVWKFVPELNLGLVAKIDMEETDAPITDLRHEILLIAMIIFSTTLLISTGLSKSLSRPLVKLAAFSRKVGSGDLTHSITLDSKDEVGQLATSFNEMTQSLLEARETEMARALRHSEAQKDLLEISNRRYEQLVETIPYGIQEIDIEGTILFGSQAYHEMLGYEKESLVGRNIRALFPNGKFQGGKSLLDSRPSTQPEPGIYTEQYIKKDGTIIDLKTAWNYKRNSAGKVVGFVSVLTDITEKKRAEATLHDQEERIRVIYEQSNDAIFLLDLEHDRIVESNRMASSLLGYSAQELSCRPVSTIHPNEMEALQHFNQSLSENKGGLTKEFSCLTKGNKKVPVEISASHILIKGKTYLLALVRDITEQKRSKAEREVLITDLENRNAEMERFTYTISHDLKSPLITIGGYLHLIEKALSEGKTETVESDLYRISSAVANMENLLRDLLSISRIGYDSSPSQTILLMQVAEEALAMVQGILEDKNIQVKIEPNLPLASGNPIRIREVFTNLIENAVKFMGDQCTPVIEIGARHDKRKAIICVKDNGIGIDPRYHENIFGLFNRLDKAVEGTGVGLALVKRIVEVHGGRIWVESEGDGQGSTFCFTLPGQVPLEQKTGDRS